MDNVHNSIIDHFEFVQKGKQKLRNRLFFGKNQETAKKRSLVILEKLRNADYLKLENF